MDVCDIAGACDEPQAVHRGVDAIGMCGGPARGSGTRIPDAIDTLHTVLEVAGRLAAPLLPLITEVIWRGITGERSVHLTDWPESGTCRTTPTWSRPWTRCARCLRGLVAS